MRRSSTASAAGADARLPSAPMRSSNIAASNAPEAPQLSTAPLTAWAVMRSAAASRRSSAPRSACIQLGISVRNTAISSRNSSRSPPVRSSATRSSNALPASAAGSGVAPPGIGARRLAPRSAGVSRSMVSNSSLNCTGFET